MSEVVMKEEDEKKLEPPDPTSFGVYYARLLHQQNMLQDSVRTDLYRRAIVMNDVDFEGRVVLDVGSGTGILSFFAAQAGAGRVYAVEASGMADKAARLVGSRANAHLARYAAHARSPLFVNSVDPSALQAGDLRIFVVKGKVENVSLPESVDVIVSEPLGFMLVHERMLEALVAARDRFLAPGGLMFPTTGAIQVLPITDVALWNEQAAKASFWRSDNFYGVDLTDLYDQALDEYFSQAVVGYFSPDAAVADHPASKLFDFRTLSIPELRAFDIPLDFVATKTAVIHGLGCWFEAVFHGSKEVLALSTGPTSPGTHWYQCRLLFRRPIAVNATQRLDGRITATVNDRLSYDLLVTLHLQGTDISTTQRIRLDDQMYHYLQAPAPPMS
ncbi:hypothetical protein CTAYLR_002169 [Chrysophaeum taylorii]|uniref:type I protein arginine methyltransferase n=1 Tax=Chrysophaeum taylorii TaxID=2483200 RepID=A0AAD7XU73_9STRA|nr:hypothetical protein CTAYLR_002169 [Chrysophaeum taylorii]